MKFLKFGQLLQLLINIVGLYFDRTIQTFKERNNKCSFQTTITENNYFIEAKFILQSALISQIFMACWFADPNL